jgi:hypothetical protein
MIRIKLLSLLVCVVGLFFLHGCTAKKEIPQPVVDTQRLDQLREEYRNLQATVLGNTSAYLNDSLTYTQLQAQITALELQLAKKVSYSVIVGDYQGNLLSGATVKVSQAGTITSQTTSTSGVATIPNLNGGIISATVELAGFARLVYRADIRNYNTDQAYSVSTKVLLLPMGGTAASDLGMSTFNVNLYANFTTPNDTLGGPDFWGGSSLLSKALPVGPDPNNPTVSYTSVTDKPITVYLSADFLSGCRPPTGFTYKLITSGGEHGDTYDPGSVLSLAYENATYKVASATGPGGAYVLKLPATSFDGETTFDFDVTFPEFLNSFTEYVPNGTGVHIDPPFSPTVITNQVFRIQTVNLQSNPANNTSTRKYFYFNKLN